MVDQMSSEFGNESIAIKPKSPQKGTHWNAAVRIAFRFCFVYFIFVCLVQGAVTSLIPIPGFRTLTLDTLWPFHQITFWAAAHIFHLSRPLAYLPGSDTTYTWIRTFCLLIIAAVIVVVWSVLDRRREDYVTLHKWLRLFVRFVLAAILFGYGFFKVIPLQMTYPSLERLVEPFGHFTPSAVLFWSVGASRPYEIFTGLAEVLGGILLIVPRTTALGSLVCLAVTIEVFVLNMAYDVLVKLFSFHLVLFSLFLLATDARRMFSFFLSNRSTGASTQPPLFQSARANRIALVVQVLFGLFLIGMNLGTDIQTWFTRGGGRPKPSLYGIWDVEQMTIDGQVRSPLLTDYDRWRRVLFDYTTSTSFQRMDDNFVRFGSSINDQGKTITLTKPGSPNWKASLTFDRPTHDQLTLEGTMDGHKIQMKLNLFDRNKMTLVSNGFHWITNY